MALFRRKTADRERIEALQFDVTVLTARLTESERIAEELRERLAASERLGTAMAERLSDSERNADESHGDLQRRLDELSDGITIVDTRVTSVSTELANQVSELGNEIDALGEAVDDRDGRAGGPAADVSPDLSAVVAELHGTVDEVVQEVLDEVESSQQRLAAEQVRYQIQFRSELAEVADRLRRPRAS